MTQVEDKIIPQRKKKIPFIGPRVSSDAREKNTLIRTLHF